MGLGLDNDEGNDNDDRGTPPKQPNTQSNMEHVELPHVLDLAVLLVQLTWMGRGGYNGEQQN